MRNLNEMQNQFNLSLARAQLWVARATTGEAKSRKLYHGTYLGNKNELTDKEKIADALGIAKAHIGNAAEMAEAMEVARKAGIK